MRPLIKRIALVAAILVVAAPAAFTLWLRSWDANLGVGQHQVLVPGVRLDLQTVRTARGPVQFDMYGAGGPVILSIHAGLGGADQGRLFASWLQGDGFRILSPSRPGYLGTPLGSGKTLAEQADLLAALLDKLAIQKVGVMASSAGGPVAYTFAARYPDRVWGLVAIDCVSRDDPGTWYAFGNSPLMGPIGQKLVKLTANLSLRTVLSGTLDETSHFTKAQRPNASTTS